MLRPLVQTAVRRVGAGRHLAMSVSEHTWAAVLAAGDGTRLSALTINSRGECIPKQYCSVDGHGSLLHHAIERARRVAAAERVCVIVAEQHRRHWRAALWPLPLANTIVQPSNRGTGNGVLLGVLSILRRDPLARIVFLPADHHVSDEPKLAITITDAVGCVASGTETLALVGIEPDEPDPELGYILPGRTLPDGSRAVEEFVEKPPPARARDLVNAGALWNSFIFAATGSVLLERLRVRTGWIVRGMTAALSRDTVAGSGASALIEFYELLPLVDFSRSVLQPAADSLRVFTAPRCGWSDLGTPKGVARTLEHLRTEHLSVPASDSAPLGFVAAADTINLTTRQAHSGHSSPGAVP